MQCRYPVVSFAGPKEVGKSTAASILVNAFGSVKLSFADPIRWMLIALGVTDYELRVDKNAPIVWAGGKSSRQLMQSLGTEYGRKMVSPDLWMNAVDRRIGELIAKGHTVVIDDARFDNEGLMVRKWGGIVVELTKVGKSYSTTHDSERGLSRTLIDRVIPNDGTLSDLESKLMPIVRKFVMDQDSEDWQMQVPSPR